MLRTLCLGLMCVSFEAAAQEELAGRWTGTAEREGQTAQVILDVQAQNGELSGMLGFPEYGVLGRPVESIEVKRSNVSLTAGSFIFDGKVRDDQYEGIWTWNEGKASADFRLERDPDTRPYTEEEVVFHNPNDGVKLAATLFVPKGPGPYPGIAMMHGSGDNLRWVRRFHADFFARLGMVSLHFDKRGNGESTGDWKTVGFEPLAWDGVAALHYLRTRKEVDPERVGFWGISQAGWIMPLAAQSSGDVAFILTTSGAAVSVEEEGYYDYLVQMRDAGYSEADQAEARRILEMDRAVTRTGEGYEELMTAVRAAVKKPWWKTLGFFAAPAGNSSRTYYRMIVDFDPRPILEEIDVPILWMYGSEDKSVEPSMSIAILRDVQQQYGKDYTIVEFPDADHGLRVPNSPGAAFPMDKHVEGYYDTMARWLGEHVGIEN